LATATKRDAFRALLEKTDLTPDEIAAAGQLGFEAAEEETREAIRSEFDEREINAPFDPEDDPERGGNVYRPVKHYMTVPTWWRPFMYRLLKPRDIVVYLYVCSFMSDTGRSHPTLMQMQLDMNLSNAHSLIEALKRLHKYGFLVVKQQRVAGTWLIDRNVFYRPSPEYTLLTLLRTKKIDAKLNCSETLKDTVKKLLKASAQNKKSAFESGASKGLRQLIGGENFEHLRLTPADQRRECLIHLLELRLEELRENAAKPNLESAPAAAD
jgi:hypothetical protein